MTNSIFNVSLVSVESIVDEISRHGLEPEKWLAKTAQKLNSTFKEFRDSLRQHENSWSRLQYLERSAFHYYAVSLEFNELFRKHQVDLQSVVHWMEKCVGILRDIPRHQLSKPSLRLLNDSANNLKEIQLLKEKICATRFSCKHACDEEGVEKFVELSLALGDVPKEFHIQFSSRNCDDKVKQIGGKFQNIALLKVIAFLEESISNPRINPILASTLSHSLSKAYYCVGIPMLKDKYNNTSMHLIKTCLNFNSHNKDAKHDMKTLIQDLVKDRSNLLQVKKVIAESYCKPLTSIDHAYIDRKYFRFCSQEFVEESVIYFRKLKEYKSRQIIVDLLPQLKMCDSLLQIPSPLTQLHYYILLKQDFRLLEPEDADKSLKLLKIRCFETVMEYVELAKKELRLLEVLIGFMDSFKDTQYLEAVLDLRYFRSSECLFSEFIRTLLNMSEFGSDFSIVQQAAKPLQHETDLFYLDKFKELILSYLKPPEIRLITLDGRGVLQVCSKKIVISDVLRQEKFNEILADPYCEEVRFVGTNAIHVDEHFKTLEWKGKNLVVITKSLFVHGKISWDVSGKDSVSQNSTVAGSSPNGCGLFGRDGEAGESGGNVLILSESILNQENLTVISHGGAGGNGQDGGNGADGCPGKSIGSNNFKSKFPPVAKFNILPRFEHVLRTLKSISELDSHIKLLWYDHPAKTILVEDRPICDLNYIIFDIERFLEHQNVNDSDGCGNFYIEAVTKDGNEIVFSFERGSLLTECQAFLLFKGSYGKPGNKGGEYGLGGDGGSPGEVAIINTKDFNSKFDIIKVGSMGETGKPGRGGKFGNHGVNGHDVGYLDCSISLIGKWPKYFGLEGSNKINLTYHLTNNGSNIWCPYRRYRNFRKPYVDMKLSSNEHRKGKKYEERANTCSRTKTDRASLSKATRKKTISISNVKAQYQKLFNSLEKASLRNIYDELTDANAQAVQAIEDDRKMQDEIVINLQVMRCVTSSQGRNRPQYQDHKVVPVVMNTREGDIDSVISSLIEHPDQIEVWLKLKTMRVTKIDLEELYNILDRLITVTHPITEELIYINDLLLEKYRFGCLYEISSELQRIETRITSSPNSIDPIASIRYLKIGLSPINDSNDISHRILGRLDQYIFRNQDEERSKLSEFCRNELECNENVFKFLKTFVLEAGNLEESSQSTKNWYQKYTFFTEKEKRGLIVFQESIERLDREFITHCASRHGKLDISRPVICDFIQSIESNGSSTSCCLELLAYVFNVNIRLYNTVENQNNNFVLKENFNPECRYHYHLLFVSDKHHPLVIDVDYWKLEQKRELDGIKFSKIINDTKQFMKIEEFDLYLAMKTYNKDSTVRNELIPYSDLKTTVDKIVEHFTNYEDKLLLAPQLLKLSPEYIGKTSILENICTRFSIEGTHISAQELLRLVNSVLESAEKGRKITKYYNWVVQAYPQDQWINELLLTDIETFFRKSIASKSKWRQCLLKVKNKAVLILLRDKLRGIDPDRPINVACIDEILYLLSKIPTKTLKMDKLELAEWPYALKETYWKYRLLPLVKWNKVELSSSAYHALSIENMCGPELIEKFIQILITKKSYATAAQILSILSNFNDERWNLCESELLILSNSGSIKSWVNNRMQSNCLARRKIRDIESLITLVNENANTSVDIKGMLPEVRLQLGSIRKTDLFGGLLENTGPNKVSINQYSEVDITEWVHTYKTMILSFNDDSKKKEFLDSMKTEVLAVINRGIELKRNYRLRDTQVLAILILLQNVKSTLAQVATGEGKSLIVVVMAIIKSLKGEKVDIITSSSVLAKRDAEINADIYNLFGINVSHNCNEDVEIRKAAYSGNQVVYGDLSDFQRDYLLHEFYSINVLGDRNLESVVVDEVDSMLLDKGNNMLYLSHGVPGLDKLESLYLFVWQWINRPCCDRAGVLRAFDTEAIKDSVLYDLFGLIRETDIKSLDSKMTDVQAGTIWECLVQSKIIDSRSRPIRKNVDRSMIEKALFPEFLSYTDRLLYLIMECLQRERAIQIPNYLKPFVELHLDKWISNAIRAYFMKAGEDYVVDVDRTGTSGDRNPNIMIIDKDTGTDQANSQWVEALHQFLQLKHNCKISTQTLKAVFISNVSYFKLYDKLYGLTGTLGSRGERKLLKDVHGADFVTIPTAKPKEFYEESPIVCSKKENWSRSIQEVCDLYVWKKKRSVLIVCESINDVEILRQSFGAKETYDIHTYTREYEEFDITQCQQELGPGKVIIATNLAGRGTDIKINRDLKSAGGLHVILSYLPNNIRIEQQAFGRAARRGEKGSGQLIIMEVNQEASTIIQLKNKRDQEELERISKIKLNYENQICAEERCFDEFKKHYKALAEVLKRDPKEVQDILLKCCIDKWAFWLDENSKFINHMSNSKLMNSLNLSMNRFISQLNNLKCRDARDWVTVVDGCPVSMVKLAKYFLRKKEYVMAVKLFDSVIQSEPDFSAAAHYYKAGVLGNMLTREPMTQTDDDIRREFESELLQAAKLFDKHGNDAIKNSAIVGKIKSTDKQGIVQIDAYKEQSKNIKNLYRVYSQSIRDILGHEVMPHNFINYELNEALASKLHQHFLSTGVLDHLIVRRRNMSKLEMEFLSHGYEISETDLDYFLKKWDGKRITSFRGFKADMKHNLSLPSKENFWKELIHLGVLSDEMKYLIIDEKKLSDIDPSLLDSLNEYCESEQKLELVQDDGSVFLNPEQIPDQKTRGKVFLKEEFVELIGRERYLALKNREVFSSNSKCRLDTNSLKTSEKLTSSHFSSYDSISIQDFMKNNVSEKEAAFILEELVEQKIIQRRTGIYHRLVCNFLLIDTIHLTCPVYEAITKSLLYTCFAYRIAFQKIISQVKEQQEQLEAVSLQLKTKPHLSLFWDLYESKVIYPIKVNKGKHTQDSVQKALSITFNKDEFIQLLNKDECVPREDAEGLMSQLINKSWLNVLCEDEDTPSKLEVNRLKAKREALDRRYKTYEKTTQKILDDLIELSEEATLMRICRSLERLTSHLESVDVPHFGLKSIKEIGTEGNFSKTREMYNFISNGLDEILILEDKEHTFRMKSTETVVNTGICQIAIGATIDLWSIGVMTYAGNSFISEGLSDIIFAIGAVRSGFFNWKDHGSYKIENLLLTAVSAAVSASSRGTKLSRLGNKLNPPRAFVGGLKSSETVGAQVLRTANLGVGKEMIKHLSLKTLEGVEFGVANMAVDEAVDNFLQSFCESISSEIIDSMEKELKSHKIASILRNLLEVFGNNAQAMISDSTRNFFGSGNDWKEFEGLAGKIYSSISRGLYEVTANKVNSGQTAGNLSFVIQHMNHSMVWVDQVKHLQEIRELTILLLDDLSKEIEKTISNKTPVDLDSAKIESNQTTFENEVLEQLKNQLYARSSQIISHSILKPLVKEGTFTLIRYGGGKIKDFYRRFNKMGYVELFDDYKHQYDEIIENAGGSSKVLNAITKEYHENLLSLLSKTMSPELFADIIRENVPMDMTCLQAFINVLPYILQKQGIDECIKIIVEGDGNDEKQVFSSATDRRSVKVIRLRVKDNHFEVVGSGGKLSETQQGVKALNDCLYGALSEHIDLGVTEDQFRELIASMIREDQDMRTIIRNGWHRFGMSLKMHEGAHPYDHQDRDDWTFDPDVDLDLCKGEWVDSSNGTKWREHRLTLEELHNQRTEAYIRTLQRINEIVNGRSNDKNWSKCELLKPKGRIFPEDFEATIYDTIRVAKDFGSIGSALYPVELKTNIQVKQGDYVIHYEVNINMNSLYRDLSGPQGPHIGFQIRRFEKNGPRTVTGHCLINEVGNEYLPHRAKETEDNKKGIYLASDELPEFLPRIPVRKLFIGPNKLTTYLERNGNQSPRNKSYPTSHY